MSTKLTDVMLSDVQAANMLSEDKSEVTDPRTVAIVAIRELGGERDASEDVWRVNGAEFTDYWVEATGGNRVWVEFTDPLEELDDDVSTVDTDTFDAVREAQAISEEQIQEEIEQAEEDFEEQWDGETETEVTTTTIDTAPEVVGEATDALAAANPFAAFGSAPESDGGGLGDLDDSVILAVVAVIALLVLVLLVG